MTRDLRSQAVKGVFWTGLGQVMRQVVQVVGSIALARMLAPDDFGVLGMAMFFVGIGQLFADFGIGSAIVQARMDDRVVLSTCFWLNMAVAGTMALTILIASPWIAAFYHRQDLTAVIAVLSINLLIAGSQVVPLALLYRDMRFADLARVQVLGSLAGASVAIAMAWSGAGVWALVAQPLVGSSVTLSLCIAALRWRPCLEFSWVRTEPLARFSFALLGTNLVGYANRNVDSMLVGRFLGAGPLGIYSMAIQLMLYPLQQVSSVIVRVLFPTLVKIKDDPERMRGAYLKAVGAIAFITFPMMAGLFAVADDFVLVVFGDDWIPMAPVLKILAWVGMMQSVATTVGTIYLSVGKPQIALKVSLVAMPVLIVGMVVGLNWGILGVAIGYCVASYGLFYYSALMAFRLISLKITDFHAAVGRPLLAALGMVLTLEGIVPLLSSTLPMPRLSIMVVVGITLYLCFSLLINRQQLSELIAILASISRRPK